MVAGDDRFPGFAACSGFPDALEKPRASTLEWLSSDGVTRSLAIPRAGDDVASSGASLSTMRAVGSGVLVLFDSIVWRYELALGEAEVVALMDLPIEQLELSDFAFLDGERGVGVGERSIALVDLESDTISELALAVGTSPKIVYADAARVIVQLGDPERSVRVIDLR